MREQYGTLSETINALRSEGYTIDFNICGQLMICLHLNIAPCPSNIALSPDVFEIDKVYRFEGATNPDDQSILYAISKRNSDLKGVLVNGYGISSDEGADVLISRLKIRPA